MINRANFLMVREFLVYQYEVVQNSSETVENYREGLRHVLSWADETYLSETPNIRPTFPEYITNHREDGREGELSVRYQGKILNQCREFLKWALENVPSMSSVKPSFIATLIVRRSKLGGRLEKREYYTLDEILTISALEPHTLRQQRDIAAVCFMFLSGIRIGAFVSLPCKAINLARRRVEQSPQIGVNTKNSKAAVTFLLPIEGLMEPIRIWDKLVRPVSGDNGYWFAPVFFNGKTSEYKFGKREDVLGNDKDRENIFRASLLNVCERAGIAYKSPHKIRHGFGVYGVKHAKDIKEMKAISQNMMHANMGITDGLYGKLAEDDLDDIMGTFGM
jgi:site-specific recombinase XerD